MSGFENEPNPIKWFILRKSLSPDPETDKPMILLVDAPLKIGLLNEIHLESFPKIESLGELGSEIAAMAGFARRFNFITDLLDLASDFELDETVAEKINREFQEDIQQRLKAKLN